MFPWPPRPVVTTEVLRVGVWRSEAVSLGDSLALAMLPAPPRPWDANWELIVLGVGLCVCCLEKDKKKSVSALSKSKEEESGRIGERF